jgi:hypothetical protein
VSSRQPTLAVDFDGVIHAYSKGWQGGEIYDEPVEGCAEALRQLSKRYEMVVFTARHNLEDVHKYLVRHSIRHHFKEITNRKPQAEVYLDDRGLKFLTWEQTLGDLYA